MSRRAGYQLSFQLQRSTESSSAAATGQVVCVVKGMIQLSHAVDLSSFAVLKDVTISRVFRVKTFIPPKKKIKCKNNHVEFNKLLHGNIQYIHKQAHMLQFLDRAVFDEGVRGLTPRKR